MTLFRIPKINKKTAVSKNDSKKLKETYQETKANNETSVRFNKRIFSICNWIGVVEEELRIMNERKEGHPYEYCDTMIIWIMMIMGYHKEMTLRKVSGIAKGILFDHGLKGPHYSTILRRIKSIVKESMSDENDSKFLCSYVKPKTNNNKIRAAVDSTGLNLSKTTLWRENKWGTGPKRRGWLKLHALVDIDTCEIIAYVLTDDKTGDNSAFKHLINLAINEGYSLKVVFADAAYEDRKNWKMLDELNIEFVVRFKSSTVAHSNGSLRRGRAAELWITKDYEEWKKITNYGMRWKVECAFSDFKRLVAETVSAVTTLSMIAEVFVNVNAFNQHKRIRANMIGITRNDVYIADW